MKRLFFACLVGMFALGGFTSRATQAEHPDFVHHFHVVPQLSRLVITGGFAGVHEPYLLTGEYDFAHGSDHGTGPGLGSFARFENAEIWGSLISDLPTPAIVLDVDERLNLEGLKGEQLPVAAPFDVFKFRGDTPDGSHLVLFASVLGPWMYVRGQSHPPQGGADFFDYHLRMVGRSPRPFADFNHDGIVSAADYTVFRDSQGSATGASIDGAGLSDWKSQFGEQVPDFKFVDDIADAEFTGSASAAAVPEPSSVALFLAGVLLCARVACPRLRGHE